MQRDIHAEITDRIIAALEAGTRPWQADWVRTGPALRVTGEEYRGINQLLLTLAGGAKGYASSQWMTFKQALDLGGSVRKGERSTMVVFFKKLEIGDDEGEGDEAGRKVIPMLRSFNVFNVEQIDGLPDRFAPAPLHLVADKQRDDRAEAAIRSCGADIREGGGRACYVRGEDVVRLPDFERFHSVGGFLATMAHECVHWTGAPHRLDRTKGARFGDADYAFEELVAEIGAAFVCGRLRVAGEHFENHAAYVASWLKALRDDKKLIFKAAALAQSAADMVLANGEKGEAAEPVREAAPVRQLSLAIGG